MENVTFEILNSIFSKARLSPYLKEGDSANQVLTKYHANILLSEAMLPTLHYLEVCLRYRIDQVLSYYYSSNWLIKALCQLKVSEIDINKIEDIKLKVGRKGKRASLHDDIIAQMTFGFWSSFFCKKYDPIIWQRKGAIKTVFPNLARINRKRSYIEARLLKIKEVRNRIAHHEPVWNNRVSIHMAYTMCHELIQAMSIDALAFLKSIDRFPETFKKLKP
jgi:hypothetical protein